MITVTLINADVLAGLATLPDESIDSCVCDPPYELSDSSKTSPHRVFEDVEF